MTRAAMMVFGTMLMLLCGAAWAEPTVSNVRASQRGDGSGMVDVYYDLSGVSGQAWVTVIFSLDGGATYTVVPTSSTLTGDVRGVASGGSGKHIVWNAGADKPGVYATQCRPRVSAWSGGTVSTVYLPGGVPLELVAIPPGSFQMGANSNDTGWSWSYSDDVPAHTVTINYGFQMGRFEVTQRQWLALMSNPGWSCYGVGDNYPAYYVTWNDIRLANGFLDKLNAYVVSTGQGAGTFRLPSEAEWEYACRAGSQTRFCFGNSDCSSGQCSPLCNLGDYAWFCGNNSGNCGAATYGAKPVGGKLPNAFGLFDMHGNLWEWCEDWYHSSYTGAPTDGSAWVSPAASSRVLRGGGWNYTPSSCRSAARGYGDPSDRNYRIGFRVVR